MARAAFTLIEIVAVVILLGLLLAISPMALDTIVSERELEAEISKLGTTVELLHNQAILDRAEYALHIDTREHRYAMQLPEEVEQDLGQDGEPRTVLVLDKDIELDELDWERLPEGIQMEFYQGRKQITDGTFRIVFTPNGTVDPLTLVLESNNISSLDERDRTRTLKINFPGFVSLAVGRVVEDFKKTEAELGR